MPEEIEKEDNGGLVLPIVCPYCSKQVELEILFNLLPPKAEEEKINDIT